MTDTTAAAATTDTTNAAGAAAGAADGASGAGAGAAAAGTANAGTAAADAAKTADGGTVLAGKTDTAAVATSAATDWRATITDPDQAEFAKRLASPADAVKVALDLRKANSSMIRVPGKDAKPEEIATFRKAIGVPEKAEDYKFDIGREPTDQDKAIQGALAKVALETGVPASAMSALTKAVTELAKTQKDEANRIALKGREDNEAALRKELGADYEAHTALAQRALMAFGDIKAHPEAIEFFDKTMVDGVKLGDHPVVLRMFGNIGRRMGEGDFIGAVGADQRQTLQSELNTIMAANPPGTASYAKPEVQKRVMEINEALHGNAQVVGAAGRTA